MLKVGTTLRRTEPQGDAHDRLRCVGVLNVGADNGGYECVLQPAEDFGEAFSASYESITFSGYEIESEPEDEPAEWVAGLEEPV